MLFPLPESPFHCLQPGNCPSSFRTSRKVPSSEKTPPTTGGWLVLATGCPQGQLELPLLLFINKGVFLHLLCEALIRVLCPSEGTAQGPSALRERSGDAGNGDDKCVNCVAYSMVFSVTVGKDAEVGKGRLQSHEWYSVRI